MTVIQYSRHMPEIGISHCYKLAELNLRLVLNILALVSMNTGEISIYLRRWFAITLHYNIVI